ETGFEGRRALLEPPARILLRVGTDHGHGGDQLDIGGSGLDRPLGAHGLLAAERAVAVVIEGPAEELVTEVARPVAEENDSPALGVGAVREFDGGERYLHHHLVAGGGTRGGAAPHGIPGGIFIVLLAECVPLRASCAAEQLVRPLRVVEGAEKN